MQNVLNALNGLLPLVFALIWAVSLKGKSPQTVYTFTLVTRGGLNDFDPALKKGDSGVFFLKLRKQEGEVEKAYWGSVATFPKNHFDLTEKK